MLRKRIWWDWYATHRAAKILKKRKACLASLASSTKKVTLSLRHGRAEPVSRSKTFLDFTHVLSDSFALSKFADPLGHVGGVPSESITSFKKCAHCGSCGVIFFWSKVNMSQSHEWDHCEIAVVPRHAGLSFWKINSHRGHEHRFGEELPKKLYPTYMLCEAFESPECNDYVTCQTLKTFRSTRYGIRERIQKFQ